MFSFVRFVWPLRELVGRLTQLVERLLRLRAAVARSVGRRAPHRVGGRWS